MKLITLFFVLFCCVAVSKVDINELKAKSRGWTFTVGDNGMLDKNLKDITGLKIPADWKKRVQFLPTKLKVGELPKRYDVRDVLADKTPPIRDQGYCGSCWAFGTTASFEFALALKSANYKRKITWWNPLSWLSSCSCDNDPEPEPNPEPNPQMSKDLSEQEMVSCSRCGTCDGGWFCHDWQKIYGQATEEDFPYTARDDSCKQGLTPYAKISDYYFVGQGDTPTRNELKQAIHTYGAVAVTVTANSAMQAYTSGVFNGCSDAQLNHLVNLIGWDDDQGVWYMRNSWGTNWGEKGYMRIKYECSRIGEIASFVVY